MDRLDQVLAPYCLDEQARKTFGDALLAQGSIREAAFELLRTHNTDVMRPLSSDEIASFIVGYERAKERYGK